MIHNNGVNCIDVAVSGYGSIDYSAWIVETEDGKDLSYGEAAALGGEYVFEPLEVVVVSSSTMIRTPGIANSQ